MSSFADSSHPHRDVHIISTAEVEKHTVSVAISTAGHCIDGSQKKTQVSCSSACYGKPAHEADYRTASTSKFKL